MRAVMVRLDDEDYEQIKRIAEENATPVSIEVRRAIRQYLREHK